MRDDRLRTHADATQRAQRAWAARVAGGTWQQAADLAGFADSSSCIRGVQRYFGTLPQTPDSEESRLLWRERMELLWRLALTDVQQQRSGAVRAAVAVAGRAAALDGLDQPQRVEVTTNATLAVYGGSLIDFIKAGGLPTRADCERYGITDAEIKALQQGDEDDQGSE